MHLHKQIIHKQNTILLSFMNYGLACLNYSSFSPENIEDKALKSIEIVFIAILYTLLTVRVQLLLLQSVRFVK